MLGNIKIRLLHLRYRLFHSLDFNRSIQALETLQARANHPDQLFEIPFQYRGFGEFESIRPKQVIYEIKTLYDLVQEMAPRYVCEIGTYGGGTFYLWCKAAQEDALMLSLDLPGGLNNAFSPNRIEFYRHFARAERQQLHFIAADSHQPATARQVAERLGSDQLDFLFIDGDHSYDGVKRDFELYQPFVCPGGVTAFHDILPRPDFPDIQVYRLWNEIKSRYRSQEIIAQDGPFANFTGIGVLWNEPAQAI